MKIVQIIILTVLLLFLLAFVTPLSKNQVKAEIEPEITYTYLPVLFR